MERVRAMKQLPNIRTDNLKTNNLITNNPLTYSVPSAKMRSAVNYLKYSMKPLPPPYVSPLQQEVERKKDYWFDYDDPTQINSYADVIMKTITNIGSSFKGIQTWKDTFKSLASDTQALLYKGTIQPLLNKDIGALFNNQFVNFSETVDLVDNIWKGFAIQGGLLDIQVVKGKGIDWAGNKQFSFKDAMEGARQAVVDRKNFDFETGNKIMDMVLEMLTPTNIAIWVSTYGAGNIAREAVSQSGAEVSEKVVKAFGRYYTGDVHKAIYKMPFNLKASEIKALESVAKHATNLKILAGVNKFKNAVNVVDSLGPKVAIQGTVGVPWKIIKAASKAPSYVVRYFANAIDKVQAGNPDPGLFSTLAKRPEYEEVIKTFSAAHELTDEPEVLLAFSDILSGAATKDNRKINNIYKEFTKSFDNKTLMKQYIQQSFEETGKVIPWESAEELVRKRSVDTLIRSLDVFARETSGGLYKTFDEYINLVNTLYNVTEPSKGLKGLYETIATLEPKLQIMFATDLTKETTQVINHIIELSMDSIRAIQDGYAIINETKLKELHLTKRQLIKDLPYSGVKEQLLKHDDYLRRLSQIEFSIENMKSREPFRKLVEVFGETNIPTDYYELQKFLIQLPGDLAEESKSLTRYVNMFIETDTLLNQIERAMPVDISKVWNQIKNFDYNMIPKESVDISVNASEAVVTLSKYKEVIEARLKTGAMTAYKESTLETLTKYIDNTIETVQAGASVSNKAIQEQSLNSISDIGKEFISSLETSIQKLQDFNQSLFKDVDLSEGMKELSKSVYGDNILKFANDMVEQVEDKLKDKVTDAFNTKVQQSFYDANGVDHNKFMGLLTDIDSLIKSFDDTMLEGLGTMQGDADTLVGMTEEATYALIRIKDAFNEIAFKYSEVLPDDPTKITHNIDTKMLQNIFDEIHNLRYNIERSIKNHQEIIKLRNVVTFEPELLSKFQNTLDIIDSIQDSLGLTADIQVGWTKEVMNSYTLKLNAALRNLYILQTSDLDTLLDAVAVGDYASVPALETLEYVIQNYDTEGLRPLQQALQGTDIVKIQEAYFEIMGDTFDPLKVTRAELIETVDTILDVKAAAETIIDTLEGMVSVRKFYGDINKAVQEGLDKEVASTFLDAIQRLYDKPATIITLSDLRDQPDLLHHEVNKVINNIELQLRSSTLKYNVKAANWRNRLLALYESGKITGEELGDYKVLFGDPNESLNMTHTAVADAYSEYLIHKHVLKNDVDKRFKYVYMDIEANGLNLVGSTVYQKSIVIPEHNIFRWYINTGVLDNELPMEDELYYLLFGDSFRTQPLHELQSKFKQIYQDGDIDVLKEHFGITDPRIEIIPVKGEKELLEQSMSYVRSQRPPGGALRYRLHNGLEYDIPLLNRRAHSLGLENYYFNIANVEDTKVQLEDMLGLRRLSIDEKATIENLMMNHVSRRNSELTSKALKRSAEESTIDLSGNLGKFLPTIDFEFQDAYNKLINVFDPTSKDRVYIDTVEAFGEARELFRELTSAMESVNDSLRDLRQLDTRLKDFRLIVDAEDLAGGSRIIPDDWLKFIPEELRANHVGIDMMSFNSVDGVYVPAIAPRALSKPNLVAEYFDLGDKLTTPNMMERMTDLASNIQKTMLYIRDTKTIQELDVNHINQLHNILLEELRKVAGPNYFSPVLNDLRTSSNPLRAFATTYELYKIYDRVSNGMHSLKNFGTDLNPIWRYEFIRNLETHEDFGKIIRHMIQPEGLFKRLLNEFGDAAKLFQQDPPSGEMGQVLQYFGRTSKMSIDTLSVLEEVQDQLKYTRVLRTVPIYRGVLDSFDTFQDVAQGVEDLMHYLFKEGFVKNVPEHIQDIVFAKLRPVVESYDSIVSYNKLETVLGYLPEDMASYLRHHAKGLIVFANKFMSESFFPRRGATVVTDIINRDISQLYVDLIKNKSTYEALGISFKVTPEFTALYIKEADIAKFIDVPYKPLVHDFNMDEWIDIIVDNALQGEDEIIKYIRDSGYDKVKEALSQMTTARRHLVELTNDASTSTLELLDDIAMEKLMTDLKVHIPDALSLDTMNRLGMFEGNFFNHSILGHIDTRRKFMEYSSFNPAKTMYNAANMLESKLGTQLQYVELMQVPEFMVKNILDHGKMSPTQMVDYLKKAPHLRVAFLNDKTKGSVKDFRLASVTINSVKDLEFAKKMNAVIVDRQTYDMAYEVINNYKIKNPVMRFIDRVFVAPFKIGWLAWNYGVVARNIEDTALKNVQTTKDLAIIPTMAEMTKDYYNYKNVISEIYRYAEQQRIHIDVAVEEIFAKMDTPKISREIFDMIWEYQRAGGEVGLTKEAMNYYGDIADKLYRRVGFEDSGLSEVEFKELLNMSDDTAEQFLAERFAKDKIRIRALMDIKNDRLTYKRAYKMHELYKGRDLGVEDFITFLKSGRVQPEYREVMTELMSKTQNVRATDDILTKALQHPLISNSLSWNMQAEEILRLSLFRFMKEQGHTTAEAMAEIARTHFNYGHKHATQHYLEMAMPFSTFRTMNIVYWAEELTKSPQSVEVIAKGWEAMAGYKDRDIEDIMIRRSLQYQIFTGNLILNEDTGFTAKLNPSAIDLMNFFAAPHDYVTSSFHSAGRALWDWFNVEAYDYESEEDFYERKKRYAFELIPFAGSHINRIRTAQKNGQNLALSVLLSPLFNTTWTPAQGGAYATWNNFERGPYLSRYYPRRRYNYNRHPYQRRHYPKRYFPKQYRQYDPRFRRQFRNVRYGYKDWSGFSTFNRTYYGAYFKFRRGSAYPTKNYRSLNTAFSDVWRRSMSKKGNPKYRFLSFPTNKWTLKLKVGILRNLTSFNRWQ